MLRWTKTEAKRSSCKELMEKPAWQDQALARRRRKELGGAGQLQAVVCVWRRRNAINQRAEESALTPLRGLRSDANGERLLLR
jgi:hypothetical protein